MGVKERKINSLLALFSEKETVTIDEIKESLQINDRSVKSYIGCLRDYGIEIKAVNKKYKVTDRQSSFGNVLNNQELRVLKIILTVGENNGKLNKKDLINEISLSLCDEDGISRKTIERAVKACEDEEYIYLDENNKYRVSTETESFYITNEEEVFKFMELCDIYKEHIPFHNEINKLKNKVIEQTGYEETDCNVYCIGRKYSSMDVLKDILKQFEGFDYRRKTLEINYNSKNGEKKVLINIVTLLYYWEIDRSYVIGMIEDKLCFIDIKTILNIRETELINDFYNNREIMKKLDTMFGASIDNFYEVKVEFQNIFNINEKLQRLHRIREKSRITYLKDKIIYTDVIYGIHDFARYLRSFGSACRVIEPLELRDVMKQTYERVLKNYGEF